MKNLILSILFLLSLVSPAYAADVVLRWDPSAGATGYKIQKSIDAGATWQTPIDVGNITTYTYTNVEENALVLFRTSAYNAMGESMRTWSGAWYDHRLRPINSPSGTAIQ
jgi:hypothetical protein